MIRFKTFLTENKAEKTLDWMKSQPENEIRSLGKLENHDSYMHTLVSNDPEVRVGGLPIHHAVIDRISKIDPHPDKIHTQWLHHTWASGDWKLEDRPHVNEVLGKFIEHKKRLGNTTVPSTGKKGSDLNSYPSFHDLDRHIDEHINRPQANDPSKEFSHPDAPLVHDKDGVKVWHLNSKEASQHTRSIFNNKWCTSRNDEHCLYDDYSHQGQLHLVKLPTGEYHQYHFEGDEFMDATNKMQEPHELVKQHPQLKDVEAFKQYGTKSLPFTKNSEEAHKILQAKITKSHGFGEEVGERFIMHAHETRDPSLLDHMIWGEHHGIDPKNPPDDVRNTPAHFDLSRPNISRLIEYGEVRHVHAGLDLLDRKSHPGKSMDAEYEEAAKTGHKSVMDRLVNHKSNRVREHVAYNGDESHHDQLVGDHSQDVRAAVALKSKKHFETLRHDPSDIVRSVAIHNHATQTDLDQHYKDKSERVQEAVVKKTKNPVHLDYLRKYGLRSTIKGHAEHKYWAIKGAEDGQATSNP